MKCNIAKDLLPNYIDGLTGADTSAELRRHMETCEGCRAAYEKMTAPVRPQAPQTREIDFLKKLKAVMFRRYVFVTLFVSTAFYLFIIVWFHFGDAQRQNATRAQHSHQTALAPAADEILLRNYAYGGDLIPPFPALNSNGFAGFDAPEFPEGFYYPTYIPETFKRSSDGVFYAKYWIGPENITDFSNPVKTEQNNIGSYALFKTQKDYRGQYLFAWPCYLSEGAENVALWMNNTYKTQEGYNAVLSEMNAMKKLKNRKYFRDVKIERYEHPLFDEAYVISYNELAYEGAEIKFKIPRCKFLGYKFLGEPFLFYDFTENEGPVTGQNLQNFLKTACALEFSIENTVQAAGAETAAHMLSRDDIIKMAESLAQAPAR